jgi:aspartyl protease family protein
MDRTLPHPARTALIALAAAAITFPVALQTSQPVGHEEIVSARSAIVGASQSATPGHEAREFPRASDGLFYVTAAINGQPVRFLVDTGASVIVLSARDAARTGLASQAKYDAHIETASGTAPMAWTRIDRVEIGGRQVEGLRAAVVQQGLSVSLLGQNALAKLGPVTMEGDRLRLG